MFNGHLSTQISKLFFLKSETVPQTHLELLPVAVATLSFPRRVLAFINYSRVMQYREQHTLPHQGPDWFSVRSQRAAVSLHFVQKHKNESTQTRSFSEVTLTERNKLLVVLKSYLIN